MFIKVSPRFLLGKQEKSLESEIMYKEIRLRIIPPDESVFSSRYAALYWLVDALGFGRRGKRTAVDVLDAIFYYCWGERKEPAPEEIVRWVNKKRMERGEGRITYEAVRQYLEKLERLGVIERRRGMVRLRRGLTGETFVDAMFEDLERLREVMRKVVLSLRSQYL